MRVREPPPEGDKASAAERLLHVSFDAATVASQVAELDEVVKEFRRAAWEFAKGNPEPVKALYSHADDVTLANPFGPLYEAGSRSLRR